PAFRLQAEAGKYRMATKIAPLSGFPEWLPPQRMVEQQIIDKLRRTFEIYGFAPLQTRAVEPLDQLLRKGETSKEVYVLRRLQAEGASEDALGLHFDLTVPFARYVLENAGKLHFPFRRYQIQKAWRRGRPPGGRDPRRGATGSSCRPTSTWSTATRCRRTTRSGCRWSSRTPSAAYPSRPYGSR